MERSSESRLVPSSSAPSKTCRRLAAKSPATAPSAASIDVVLEDGNEGAEDEDSFDMDDELSVSMPSADGGSQSLVVEEVSKDDTVEGSPKAKRRRKKIKGGASLSPSKKVIKAKRAACWKYFKVINVPSDKERGAMVTKAKCRFCHQAYVYQFVEVCNNYSIKVGKGLCLDVKTRWSSTHKMLNSCIEYREAFTYYADGDSKYEWKPSEDEWKLYEKIQPILGTMAGATTAFSGSTYPTANVFYPYIVNVKIALIEALKHGDAELRVMAAAMLDKFDKYWAERNNVMVIAAILDPRFKMRYIEWSFAQMYDSTKSEREIDEINKELEGLYKKYETVYRSKMAAKGGTQSSSSSKDKSSSLASVVSSGFQTFLQSSATESSKSELLIYLDEKNSSIDDKNFNLLDYWKVNAHRFPVVSKMAKKFLTIPASSVSSESTFSTGGRILDDYRSSLSPTMVQALVCASSWIRGSQNDMSPFKFVEEDGDDDVESIEFPTCVVASN